MTGTGSAGGRPRWSALVWVAALSVAAYANSLGNLFAYDDQGIVVDNPVVTAGDAWAALSAPYWSGEAGIGRLYRPTTQAALALEWSVFGGSPLGFHAVNVVLHAAVSVLVALLCWMVFGIGVQEGRDPDPRVRWWAAFAGGAVFAVHPLHVEVVANVVGQAELWAALGVVGAVVVHLATHEGGVGRRLVGTLAVGGLFAVGFGAKESAVTLPAVLLVVAAAQLGWGRRLRTHLIDQLPRVLLLAGVGVGLLVARWIVLGAWAGEDVTAVLAGLGPGARLARVLPLWSEYARLLVWPVTLAADYDPGVIYPAAGPSALQVVMGGAVLAGSVMVTVVGWRRNRLVGLAGGWFLVTILPVSNLFFATGSLMAERTLYLPSVALSLGVAAASAALAAAPRRTVRLAATAGVVAGLLLFVRTVDRNPTWFDSFTAMETLIRDHPESWRAHRARAQGLARVGEDAAAEAAFRSALEALPNRFDLVSDAGAFFQQRGRLGEARDLLQRAVQLQPERPSAWILLAEVELLAGEYRQAHTVATQGLLKARESAELWSVLSEAYVGAGFLEAALRAREAALGVDPASTRDWLRLADLLEATGGPPERIADARRRAGG